jgi:CRISPR/Cas system-associated exonuclease Cas4 (RecB family)
MITTLELSPNQRALELTGRDYISWSAISTYQRCPLQHHFRYVEGLPEATVSASLVFGSAIHRAAEFHFRELLAGNPAPDLDTLLDCYQEEWRERAGMPIEFPKRDDVDSLGQLAERVLMAFRNSDVAAPHGTILGVEEELRGKVVEGCPELLARIDLITETDGDLVVTDLKTARSRWSQAQAELSDEQLLLYGELARRLAPERSLRLQFAVLTKTKSPVVEVHEVVVDPRRIDRTKRVFERTWAAIESRQVYPAPSVMNCSGCPFQQPCRDWTGASTPVNRKEVS